MNKYCKLQTYYDKQLKSRVTTLKLCDRLLSKLRADDFYYEKIFYEQDIYLVGNTCPYCNNKLI